MHTGRRIRLLYNRDHFIRQFIHLSCYHLVCLFSHTFYLVLVSFSSWKRLSSVFSAIVFVVRMNTGVLRGIDVHSVESSLGAASFSAVVSVWFSAHTDSFMPCWYLRTFFNLSSHNQYCILCLSLALCYRWRRWCRVTWPTPCRMLVETPTGSWL